jgi:hypothetical protein
MLVEDEMPRHGHHQPGGQPGHAPEERATEQVGQPGRQDTQRVLGEEDVVEILTG